MSDEKLHQWMHATSEDEGSASGYDSDAAEESMAIRAVKRRRISTPEEDGDDASDDNAAGFNAHRESPIVRAAHTPPKRSRIEKESSLEMRHDVERESSRRITSPEIQLRQLAKPTKSAASKTGVIYLSRIPPFMKPQTLKHLLEPYGEIGRIFLTPEAPASHTKRVKSGGNKKRSFVDGWVEFQRKRDAKIVAETLNTQIIGGKKGGWYHDDIWNIKYLKGFKWLHLTEQIANENAERAARLRAEISQTSKENKRFIANVEQAKMLEGIVAKKNQKPREQTSLEAAHVPKVLPQVQEGKKLQTRSSFRQNEVRVKAEPDKADEAAVQRVLSKIF